MRVTVYMFLFDLITHSMSDLTAHLLFPDQPHLPRSPLEFTAFGYHPRGTNDLTVVQTPGSDWFSFSFTLIPQQVIADADVQELDNKGPITLKHVSVSECGECVHA